ncbi:hypothetical protein AB6A40_000669 [Gnathostoma spinigerum]|uniref:VLRF1 domain-containing protein n=1 Tax=Gnathostoma spinigerum TaxID=75299 RepID=A0ABD6E3J2_9BILA
MRTLLDFKDVKDDVVPLNLSEKSVTDFEDSSIINSSVIYEVGDSLKCTVCNVELTSISREDLAIHYGSDWHINNVRFLLKNKPVLSEEEFNQLYENDDCPVSTEDDEEYDVVSGGGHEYFLHHDRVYSIYKCLLTTDNIIPKTIFYHPIDCVILLLSGGYFAGGVFINGKLVLEKTFSRYVVRAKQGSLQSVSDSRQNRAISAGACLRRRNEKRLCGEIQDTMGKWKVEIAETPLIFLRCSPYQRSVFLASGPSENLIEKSDPRLRSVPFETRRPSVLELQRTWQRLQSVQEHGSIGEFKAEREERRRKVAKKNRMLRRKLKSKKAGSFTESESDEGAAFKEQKARNLPAELAEKRYVKDDPALTGACPEKPDKEYEELDQQLRQSIYAAIRIDSAEKLEEIVNSVEHLNTRTALLKYLSTAKFAPDSSTFLHIAARRALLNVIKQLLSLGCDPSIRDDANKTAYGVSQNRAVRHVFSQFRAENSNMWNWNACEIPEIKAQTEEEIRRDAAKKKEKMLRKRIRKKEAKAEKKRETVEKTEREIFLSLSDREKRALAAERRLAKSLQKYDQIVQSDGNRCFQCGAVLPPLPFEYSDNRFCTLTCLQTHRRGTATQ